MGRGRNRRSVTSKIKNQKSSIGNDAVLVDDSDEGAGIAFLSHFMSSGALVPVAAVLALTGEEFADSPPECSAETT